jgi:hypothetical protein
MTTASANMHQVGIPHRLPSLNWSRMKPLSSHFYIVFMEATRMCAPFFCFRSPSHRFYKRGPLSSSKKIIRR